MGTYLGAIDLVTQNQLTIVARYGINPEDRMLGDISPGLVTISVNNSSITSRQVDPQVKLEFNVTKSIVDNMGGKSFSTGGLLKFYSNPPDLATGGASSYIDFNKNVNTNFGNFIATATNFSSQLFNTPGTYSWTVPDGVTSISVAGIGGGGGGSQKSAGGSGGGGGLVNYVNTITVVPGTTCTIVVGGGGVTGGTYGVNGSSTYLILPGTNIPIVIAQGGAGGDSMYWLSGSQGTTYVDYTGTITVQAAFDPIYRPIIYSISSGSLPTGAIFNTSTGAINWLQQVLLSDTEYSPFTISASNGVQTISKPFTLKILRSNLIFATYLVVAGGGSGGAYYYAGGGGAGGLLTNIGGSTPILPASGAYTVTIGGGGTGSLYTGTNGTISSLSGVGISVSAVGGGRGGASYYSTATNIPFVGGSGGGGGSASNPTSTYSTGAAGTLGQGFAGGNGGGFYGGGGGGSGGAGEGGSTASSPSGSGGTGTNMSSLISTTLASSSGVGFVTGSQVQFGGGGGGGQDANQTLPNYYQAQGSAGGGQGALYLSTSVYLGSTSTSGLAYTGSGGGGGSHPTVSTGAGSNGGSGVVIIRYASTVTLATGGQVIDVNSSTGYVTHIFKTSGSFVPTY